MAFLEDLRLDCTTTLPPETRLRDVTRESGWEATIHPAARSRRPPALRAISARLPGY